MMRCTTEFWPLVISYSSGELSPEDTDGWIAFDVECSRMAHARQARFVSLVGTGQTVSVNATIRKRISSHLNSRPTSDARFRAAVHMVIRSAMTRGIVMAMNWLSINRSVDKITAHDTLAAALAAAKLDLQSESIDWSAVQRWLAQCES